jgi:hypothetical protein
LTNEGQKLNKDWKSVWEKMEKLKNTYVTQARDCDNFGVEKENVLLNKQLTVDKKNKNISK